MNRLMRRGVAIVPAALLVLAACGGGGNNTTPAATPTETGVEGEAETGVQVTEKDFAISLDTTSASTGKVDFIVTNDGPSTHEFVVIKTDLDPAQLPTDGGAVEEGASGTEVIDEIEDVQANSTQKLEVDLEAGKYVLICNLPGHYQQGMHAGFTVS